MGFWAVSPVVDFGPGELCEALANIDLATVRWRRKVQLLHVLGRYPDGHRISFEALAARTRIDKDHVGVLVREMIGARIVELIEPKAGPVAALYAINPRVEQWAGVPWTSTIAEVWSFVFHAEHWGSQTPDLSPVRGARTGGKRKQTPVRAPTTGDRTAKPPMGSAGTGDNEKSASGRGRKYRGQVADLLQQQFPAGRVDNFTAAARDREAGELMPDPEGWRTVTQAVLTVAVPVRGRRFLSPRATSALRDLVYEVGAERVIDLLELAQIDNLGMGVPQLVEWLDSSAHADVEVLKRLAERAAQPPPDPLIDEAPPEPARPLLRPVAEVIAGADETPADQASSLAAIRSARAQIDPLATYPDDRINTEVTP